MRTFRVVSLLFAAMSVLLALGRAAQAQRSIITTEVSVGTAQGEAQEFVYSDTGKTVSRLDWDIENVPMLTVAIAYRPLPWLTAGVRGSTNLADWSHMNDYDFDIFGCPPAADGGTFCQSSHPGTRLESAYRIDASLAAEIIRLGGVSVSALAGYKADFYSWRAFNGTSNYAGVFREGLGISYGQTWRAPFVGIGLEGERGPWSFNARLIGSWWGDADDRDHHHSRSILFKEYFDDTRMLGLDVGVGYQVTAATRLTLGYAYQNWFLAKGPTSWRDLSTGDILFIPGESAGASNLQHMIVIGAAVDLMRPAQDAAATAEDGLAPRDRWTGPYGGVAIGAHWLEENWRTMDTAGARPIAATADAEIDDTAPLPALFAGYGLRPGLLVYGLELEAGKGSGGTYASGIPGTGRAQDLVGSPDSLVVETDFDASLRLRAGALLSDGLLVYATAGVAGQKLDLRMSCSVFGPWCVGADHYEARSVWSVGWTAGAGVEVAMSESWFLRGEYRFSDFDAREVTFFAADPQVSVSGRSESASHRLTAGLGTRF